MLPDHCHQLSPERSYKTGTLDVWKSMTSLVMLAARYSICHFVTSLSCYSFSALFTPFPTCSNPVSILDSAIEIAQSVAQAALILNVEESLLSLYKCKQKEARNVTGQREIGARCNGSE